MYNNKRTLSIVIGLGLFGFSSSSKFGIRKVGGCCQTDVRACPAPPLFKFGWARHSCVAPLPIERQPTLCSVRIQSLASIGWSNIHSWFFLLINGAISPWCCALTDLLSSCGPTTSVAGRLLLGRPVGRRNRLHSALSSSTLIFLAAQKILHRSIAGELKTFR